MSGNNSLRELFPSSERIAIGGSDPKGINIIERYQNALIRYGKQSFGIYWEVFRASNQRRICHTLQALRG